MQFLCQHWFTSTLIDFTVKRCILHRDWYKLAAELQSERQMEKNHKNHFGAISHQNGS